MELKLLKQGLSNIVVPKEKKAKLLAIYHISLLRQKEQVKAGLKFLHRLTVIYEKIFFSVINSSESKYSKTKS